MTQIAEVFVTIASVELSRSAAFYRDFFNLELVAHSPERYAEFRLPGLRLAIFCPSAAHRSEFARSAGSGLSFCVEVADLDEAIARLVEMGYPPPGEVIVASHGREVYAYDPDGNRLILHQGKASS
ncbi:MAG: VOC family protein [Geitlerinemataceae cyanobacterium]